jgi:CobQ-like glutamine amidotransferase family enzyme
VGADLVLAHLYPDLLRTYGDRGNVLTLRRRAEWRGYNVRVAEVTRGERMPSPCDLILIGGGTDRVQAIVSRDLLPRRGELEDAIGSGAVVLGVCGGYQFLGQSYTSGTGQGIEGLGILDLVTVARPGRIIGRALAAASLWGAQFELVGFENHAGRTELGPGCQPLGALRKGGGNNGRDRTEGAVRDLIVGTYLHGPLLPSNPAFADALLQQALMRTTGGGPLSPLDDTLEWAAHRAVATRRS